jgi:hypothetical protein
MFRRSQGRYCLFFRVICREISDKNQIPQILHFLHWRGPIKNYFLKPQSYNFFQFSVAVTVAKLSKMFLPMPDSCFLLIRLASTQKIVSLK